MIRNPVLRGFALTLAGAALFSSVTLQAALVQSEKISIPFSFQVQHRTLPAGEYRMEQNTSSEFASLINLKTKQRIEVLRPASSHVAGKAKLVFESTENGHRLKKVS